MRVPRLFVGVLAVGMLVSALLAAWQQAPASAGGATLPTATVRGELAPTAAATPVPSVPPVPALAAAPTDVALDPALVAQSDSAGAMARGDLARTGFYPHASVAPPLHAAWQVQLADGIFTTPAVVGGTVYVASGDGTLYALERASGAMKWQHFTGDWVLASPAIAHGQVFVLNRSGALQAAMRALAHRSGRSSSTARATLRRWSWTASCTPPARTVRSTPSRQPPARNAGVSVCRAACTALWHSTTGG